MKTLVAIVGPTGVGKTELSLQLAERLGSPIVNADSRQIYREIPIGTAAPTADEQARVKHYFVGTHSLTDDYNAGQYERDACALLEQLFETHDTVVLSGGSMMYVQAVCTGLDEMPDVSSSLREEVQQAYKTHGIEWLQAEVRRLDPEYWEEVDQQNPQRLLHAVEICLASGQTYTHFRKGEKKERPFRVVKIGLTRPREELYERINRRVEQMMAQGLRAEAERVIGLRDRNSLQTVGYKEMFKCLDGEWSEEEAVRMIQQNSRRYAKRQLTWYRADKEVHWIDLSEKNIEQALAEIQYNLRNNPIITQ